MFVTLTPIVVGCPGVSVVDAESGTAGDVVTGTAASFVVTENGSLSVSPETVGR